MSFLAHTILYLLAFIAALFPSHTVQYRAPNIPPKPHMTIIFGGDMMFDRGIRIAAQAYGGDFIFSCVEPVLQHAQLVVANLEGPITNNHSVSMRSTPGGEFNYTFTFPTSTASLLFAHNIRLVNLGNNHIFNFGPAGARSTIVALKDAGVAYFGDPIDHKVAVTDINGVKLAFINYNEFERMEYSNVLKNIRISSTTVEQIQEARARGELPVVYTHWGIEYATSSPLRIRALAHEFVDAGAEMVVGSHPHAVEEHEMYKDKHIYYSLGNFIFDQYWNDAVRHGLLLQVVFTTDGVKSIKEIPIQLEKDGRTCVVG